MQVAIIGGTGVDEIPELMAGDRQIVTTRFGNADVISADISGAKVFFVPRHGIGHASSPSRINYRAQVAALKKLGVDVVIGVCAVGSLQADLLPGSFAILSDYIDVTRNRVTSFFDEPGEPVVHTDLSVPYCPEVSAALLEGCQGTRAEYHENAVYIGVDGPRYESPAEIKLYASWGGDVIGMTNVPEVMLAREAGLCYGALGIVTNLATGFSEASLAHDDVRATMAEASHTLQFVVRHALSIMAHERICTCSENNKLTV